MTRAEGQRPSATVKEILLSNPDGKGEVIRAVMQEVLHAEMERSELEGRAHAGAARLPLGLAKQTRGISAINKRLGECLTAFADVTGHLPTSSRCPATRKSGKPAW